MNQPNNYQKRTSKSAVEKNKMSGEVSPPVKTFRAATAVVVFGIPRAAAAAILRYAVKSIYKRMRGSL